MQIQFSPIIFVRYNEELCTHTTIKVDQYKSACRTRGVISETASTAFSVAGPAVWNKFEAAVRNASTFSYFKNKLKTSLFKVDYNTMWTFFYCFIWLRFIIQSYLIFFIYFNSKLFAILASEYLLMQKQKVGRVRNIYLSTYQTVKQKSRDLERTASNHRIWILIVWCIVCIVCNQGKSTKIGLDIDLNWVDQLIIFIVSLHSSSPTLMLSNRNFP